MNLSINLSGLSKALVPFFLLCLISFQAYAKPPISSGKDGVAVDGYDAVAYFTVGKPVLGSDAYTHSWQGATWKFSSAEHRDKFVAEPEKYAPQYGGYCAYAMSDAGFAAGDGERWAIVENKLYLNNNWLAQKLWEGEIPEDIRDADGHWAKIRPVQQSVQPSGEASKP
jgi:YHS domain-containing protein